MPTLKNRLQHAWDAFRGRDHPFVPKGPSYSYKPDRRLSPYFVDRSLINSIENRIAVDAAAIAIQHVRLDEEKRYKETIESHLNDIFSLSANEDQTPRAFLHDIYLSMFQEGIVAVVPTVTDDSGPSEYGKVDIREMRVGKIVEWYPSGHNPAVKVNVYNRNTGERQDVILPKSFIAIVENPFYEVMNNSNSTMQRLVRTLNKLDIINERTASKKLDLIMQVPYDVSNERMRAKAEASLESIRVQLEHSEHGIAYIGATEHVIQLNRPIENNLLNQIDYLTKQLYAQLGLTEEIMNGTADEQQMLNYTNRILEPVVSALVDEIKRKFLTKTARAQGQSIMFFRDPFKLVPVDKIADIADKFTRNEILSSNEMRAIVGRKPVDDPKADQLINANLNQAKEDIRQQNMDRPPEESIEKEGTE